MAETDYLAEASAWLNSAGYNDPDLTLREWHDDYWVWENSAYRIINEADLRQSIALWYHSVGTPINSKRITETLKAATNLIHLPSSPTLPFWIPPTGGPAAPGDWIPFQNGILSLTDYIQNNGTCTLRPLTPDWFSTSILPYSYDPSATCPEWLKFLSSTFESDNERINLLQEAFGYLISGSTVLEAIILFVGPPRSGKGTTTRALVSAVGEENTTFPTLTSLTTTFGKWPLLGKSVAICPDAHISGNQRSMEALETLKSISGGDPQLVDRKYRPQIWTRLNTRFVLAANDLPGFSDSSHAFSSRLVVIPFSRSFVGKEDRSLGHRISLEREGIFNWALAGLTRLVQQGKFSQSSEGNQLRAAYNRVLSPLSAFYQDSLVSDPHGRVSCRGLWDLWRDWCESENIPPGNRQMFTLQLKQLAPHLHIERPRSVSYQDPNPFNKPDRPPRPRVYVGMTLRNSSP